MKIPNATGALKPVTVAVTVFVAVSITETNPEALAETVGDYLGSVLPGLGDFPVSRIAELKPAAATRN